jgi:hypothetical protein
MPPFSHTPVTLPDLSQLRLGGLARWLVAAGLVLAASGFGTGCYLGWAEGGPQPLFFHAYLTAFAFYLSITLGAVFFVMLQHLTRAGWSVTVRRLAEGVCGTIWLMALLFLPILPGIGQLYEWSPPGLSGEDSASKVDLDWFGAQAFVARVAVYFAVWGLLVWLLRSRSRRQDATGDIRVTQALERISAPGMVAFSFTLMFASTDLLMSQNLHWTSTIFGVYFFSGSVVGFLALLTLAALGLRAAGPLRDAITVEHLHDLGKLLLSFVIFWGYIAFSQYMLTWYANLPEETQFFMPRQIGPWIWVSLGLLACQLFIPLLGLLPRNAKRTPAILAFWAAWVLAAHLLDMFWVVMPNVYIRQMPEAVGEVTGTPLPEVFKELLRSNQAVYELAEQHAGFMQTVGLPLEGQSIAMLLALVVGMGGLYLAFTSWLLRGAPLVPVGDPRLEESLAFKNV